MQQIFLKRKSILRPESTTGQSLSHEWCRQFLCPCHHLQYIHNLILAAVMQQEKRWLGSEPEMTVSIQGTSWTVITFRDKEECGVEGGLDRRPGVNHPRLVDPLEGTLLRVPLHSVEWVADSWQIQEPQETWSHQSSPATSSLHDTKRIIGHEKHWQEVRSLRGWPRESRWSLAGFKPQTPKW